MGNTTKTDKPNSKDHVLKGVRLPRVVLRKIGRVFRGQNFSEFMREAAIHEVRAREKKQAA